VIERERERGRERGEREEERERGRERGGRRPNIILKGIFLSLHHAAVFF